MDRLSDCNAGRNGSRKKQQLFPAAVLCEEVKEKRKSGERVKRQKNEATKRRDNRRARGQKGEGAERRRNRRGRRQQSEAAVSGGQGECGGLKSEKSGKVQAFGV